MYLFIDMNAFFASCEQQDRPELRGIPVAVVQVLAETTGCIAVSYEARPYHIRNGTPMGDVRRLCPHAAVVEARPRFYRSMHARVVQAIETCAPVHEVLSIDEMTIAPWKNEATLGDALRLGQAVQDAIRRDAGDWMSCSVGMAPNVLLAKVASDMQKPRGLVPITPRDIPCKLLDLKLTDWPGIGENIERRFNAIGVRTTADMYRLDVRRMRNVFGGIAGERWFDAIRGMQLETPPTRRSEIMRSNVLEPAYRTRDGAWIVTSGLLEQAVQRLRGEGYHAGRLYVGVCSFREPYWARQARFQPCNRTFRLRQILTGLWTTMPVKVPSRVIVSLGDLVPDRAVTLGLFDDPIETSLDHVADSLNRRFGRNTVTSAATLPVRAYLDHGRIPFGKPTEIF